MSRVSGKWAYVDGVGHTKSWQINEAANLATIMDSASPDGSEAVDGNHDFTGSVNGNGYLSALYPEVDPFTFIGVANGKAGSLLNYLASVQVSELTIDIPVAASGGVISWAANFGVQGNVTKEAVALAYEDDVRTLTPSAKNGKVSITPAGGGAYTDVAAVQNIKLTFSRGATTYVDAGLTYREPSNLAASISFDVETDDLLVPLYAPGNNCLTKVFVTPVLFFLFDGIMWGDHTNFVIDRSTDKMVGYTVNGQWSALRTGLALGSILKPGGAALYPAP